MFLYTKLYFFFLVHYNLLPEWNKLSKETKSLSTTEAFRMSVKSSKANGERPMREQAR